MTFCICTSVGDYIFCKKNQIYIKRVGEEAVQQLDTNKCTGNVVAVTTNSNETYLVGLFEEKGLSVWSLKDLSLVSHRAIPRNALSLTCGTYKADEECVIIGEKTGEVVAFPLLQVDDGLEVLLQHTTSMVTDVVTSIDSRYLITADRDEKIRVSHFPTTVLIESYCLGHEAFVAKVAVSQAFPDLLASIDGNGMMGLWRFATGELLSTIAVPLLEGDDAKDFIPTVLKFCPTTNCVVAACTTRNQLFRVKVSEQHTFVQDSLVMLDVPAPAQDIAFDLEGKMMVVTFGVEPFVSGYTLSENTRVESTTIDALRKVAQALGVDEKGGTGLTDESQHEGEWKKKKLKAIDWQANLAKKSRNTKE